MDLPKGTVTFLFTDIEGSTRLWDLFPDVMLGALTRLEEILRGSISQQNGIVIKSTGDGLHAVFSSPVDAVKAALSGQRELLVETWNPKTGRLKVRMALHSGTADLRGGDYYGGTVNRAARLLSAGHGDQILLSQSTRELIREELPGDITLVDLGYHRLKDLLRPEHIYQLSVPDLPGYFPVLRGLDPRSVNLPSHPTPFIGRKKEIKALGRLLENANVRLITLVGPGGAGKTRLAVQAAAEFVAAFHDGALFIDLAAITEPQLVPSSIANVLGVRETARRSIEENIIQYLRSRSLLLILDNFEQVLDGANFVSQIIGGAPGIKIIATSREALSLQEEWQFSVNGMAYPHRLDAADYGDYDAVRLFVTITQKVQPDFALEDQKEGVIKICQLVEGLPLAIELAAPWMKAMAAEEIVYEIHRNISILSTSLRNLPEGHQSMVAIFEQSWSYLSSRQREVFAALSVFSGGFQLEAAEAVTGALSQTIMELVDKSLLRWSSEGRFSIHELLRQHVERQLKLSPEEYQAARNLHCNYYANFVGQFQNDMFRDRHLEAMAQLEEDIENVKTAWDWAAAQLRLEEIQKISKGLYDMEDIKGRYIEGDSLFNRVIEPLEAVSDSSQKAAVLSQIYLIQSWHAIRRGKLELARDYAEKSQESLVKHDLSPTPGLATDPLSALGVVANALGNYEQAEKLGEKALERAESLGEPLKLQFAFYVLSNAALYQGHYQEARDFALKAKAIALELGSRWFMAYILDDLGRIDQVMGEYESAKNNFRTTYKIRRDFDDPEGMALALNHLAQIALLEEDYQQAKQLFEQSRWLYLDIGDRRGLARSLSGLARTDRLQNNLKSAGNYLAEALNVSSEMGFMPLTLELLVECGELLLTGNIPEQGILLLAGVSYQPGAGHEAQEKAQQLLDSNRDRFAPELFKAVTKQGKESNLDQLLAAAKNSLADFNKAQEQASAAEPVIKLNDQHIFESLTDRELEVLGLMSKGLANPEIAERLIIALGAVESHTNQIYSKLGVRNRVEAVAKARDLGILPS